VGYQKVKGGSLALFAILMFKIFITVVALLGLSTGVVAQPKPNILIIFTDDQGYSDLGCFGSKENQTPVLDQLAKEGTRFTSFYAQPVCGPSRSALLTGRYPVRSKGWSMPASEITFGEILKEAGYQTACIGKWDVSNRKAIIDRMPNAQGFDYYFGALGANDNGKSTLHRKGN
jgi:arylsulfatase A-like enzyme